MQEVVGAGQFEFLDLVVLDHAADAQDAYILQAGVGANTMAYFLAVDVGKHDIQDDEVGTIFLDHHARIEARAGHAHLEAAVLFQDLGHELDEFGIIVDKQDLGLVLSRFQAVDPSSPMRPARPFQGGS